LKSSSGTRKGGGIEALVPFAGLSYFAAFAAFLILRGVAAGTLAPYQLFFVPLASACVLSAIGIRYKPMIGYLGGVSISVILMLIFFLTQDGNDVITVLSNPYRNQLEFLFYLTTVPTFFSTIIFSVMGLLKLRRRPSGRD
jgi:hypothetical protein